MNQLEKLRQQLQNQNQNANRPSGGADNALFPFWNAKSGTTTVVRFLPNGGSEENPFFWVERRVTKLEFDGVIGRPEYSNKKVSVTVPCMKMYDNSNRCPILEGIAPLWNTTEANQDIARKFYPKRSFIMQGFVRSVPEFIPNKEDNAPENPIRRFMINQNLFKNIQQGMLDPDMRNIPTDYINGCDFKIIKTQQGEWPNYSTSTFARSESSLTSEENAAIEQYGLFNLEEFLPNKPTPEGVAVIEEMFQASFAGLPYDPKWADFYRPWGMDFDNTKPAPAAAPAQSTAPQENSSPAPWENQAQSEPAPSATIDNPNDALARLRAQVQNSQ